ncbi:MAG: DUF2157 domain-containing protein [Planctomycetota bacterium]|nr:DUF2157 domain-containing protein [Planctomycetota bacterium]
MFHDDLEKLLYEGVGREIVSRDQADRLLELAPPPAPAPAPGFGKLAKALTLVGGFGLVLGLILIIGANWREISDLAKMGGFLSVFLAAHLGGLWVRWKHPAYDGTAEALNFVGAGLFLGGVALVAQIFHLNESPKNGVFAWLVATLPLALLLRSTPLFGMALAAALVWGPWKFVDALLLRETDAVIVIPFAAAIPFAVLFLGPLSERIKFSMGTLCRIVAGIIIGVFLYGLGFFRHLNRGDLNSWREVPEDMGTWMAAFFSSAVLLALLSHILKPGPKRMVDHGYLILALATVVAFMLAAAIAGGWWEPGEAVEQFNFSGSRMLTFRAQMYLATLLAWLLWFLWGVWFIFAGSAWNKNGLMSLGVYGIAVGLVTRYFDLVGTLAETGTYFVIGGIVLILAGYGAEKCRRWLIKRAG